MTFKSKVYTLLKAAALVAGLVVLQQLVMRVLFGQPLEWSLVPQLTAANFGLVLGWFYFKNPGKKLPVFATIIAAFCFALGLRAILIYLGVFRIVAPLVVSFIEKQIAVVVTLITMPQFIPAALAAIILLLLLPKAKDAYKRLVSGVF